MSARQFVLAIDPGREKSGIAVLDATSTILHRAVVSSANLSTEVKELLIRFPDSAIVMGNGTGHKPLAAELRTGLNLEVALVDESHTSEEARDRWRKENPASGWKRLIPDSLRSPVGPYDDTVAIILGERYLLIEE